MGLKEAEYYEIELPTNGMDGRQNNGHMDKVGMYEQCSNWNVAKWKTISVLCSEHGPDITQTSKQWLWKKIRPIFFINNM